MNKLKLAVVSCFALVGVLTLTPMYVSAADDNSAVGQIQDGVDGIGGDTGKNARGLPGLVRTVVNILMYVLGIIAVIMIIIGGIRYTTSNGDASGIKSARDTILYAVVGLVVAILSYAIVNFVLDAF